MAAEGQEAVDDFVARGVFRAEPAKVSRGETAAWSLRWFGGHVMRLAVAPRQVSADPLLPPLPARSALYRELRAWLRSQQSAELPPHRRLDPARYALELRNRGGDILLVLSLVPSADAPGDERVRRAVQLVNAIYLDFLNGPGRLEWVTGAFGLDPDNPRLC